MKVTELLNETITVPGVGSFTDQEIANLSKAIGRTQEHLYGTEHAHMQDNATQLRLSTWLASNKKLRGPQLQHAVIALTHLLSAEHDFYGFYDRLDANHQEQFRKIVATVRSDLADLDDYPLELSPEVLLNVLPYYQQMSDVIPSHISLGSFIEEIVYRATSEYDVFNRVSFVFQGGKKADEEQQQQFFNIINAWHDPNISMVYEEDVEPRSPNGRDLVADELYSYAIGPHEVIPFLQTTKELRDKINRKSREVIEKQIKEAGLASKVSFSCDTFYNDASIDEPFGY